LMAPTTASKIAAAYSKLETMIVNAGWQNPQRQERKRHRSNDDPGAHVHPVPPRRWVDRPPSPARRQRTRMTTNVGGRATTGDPSTWAWNPNTATRQLATRPRRRPGRHKETRPLT